MTKIKVKLGNNQNEYSFHGGPVKIDVQFKFNSNKEIVETAAFVKKQELGEFRYDIIKIRYCDKNRNRNLEVILKQSNKNGDNSGSKLSEGTKFDLRQGNVNGVKIIFLLGETVNIKDKCYTDYTQPEVRKGNIFTIN